MPTYNVAIISWKQHYEGLILVINIHVLVIKYKIKYDSGDFVGWKKNLQKDLINAFHAFHAHGKL